MLPALSPTSVITPHCPWQTLPESVNNSCSLISKQEKAAKATGKLPAMF